MLWQFLLFSTVTQFIYIYICVYIPCLFFFCSLCLSLIWKCYWYFRLFTLSHSVQLVIQLWFASSSTDWYLLRWAKAHLFSVCSSWFSCLWPQTLKGTVTSTHHDGYHEADVFCILPENHLRSDFRKVYESPKEHSQAEHFSNWGSLWKKTEREPAPCCSESGSWFTHTPPPPWYN